MKKALIFILIFAIMQPLFSQFKSLSSSEIYLNLQRLATVGSAMYIAAHPDDENTLLITWLSKDKMVRTAYFSMTRGDGGQNLIGAEKDEYVGLLRTHELLEARKVDGGEQYFSRAIDFGFSKSTEEALAIWGKDKILEDLVYRIRKFKPDVIIDRFPPDARAGHGHHSASAVLAIEAYDAAADSTRFPEQVSELGVWQAKRLVWNTFGRGFTNTAPEGESYIEVAIGNFNPILGKSYSEIAAEARSKHRSQGFGSSPSRTERYDYLVNIKGEPAHKDLFDGIDLSWNRVQGGQEIALELKKLVAEYDFKDPSKSVQALLHIYQKIQNLGSSVYKNEKLEECRALIFACAGLYLEVNAATQTISPGQTLKFVSTAVKRTDIPVEVTGLSISGIAKKDTSLHLFLTNNKEIKTSFQLNIPENASLTQPYWMQEHKKLGQYVLSDEKFRNLPMAPDALIACYRIKVQGQEILFDLPIKYKYTEPSRGEIYKYVEVRPELMLNFEQSVLVFQNNKTKEVALTVKNNLPDNHAQVQLVVPSGWKVAPTTIDMSFNEKDEEKTVVFNVTPSSTSLEGEISAKAENARGVYQNSFKHIFYEHIPEINAFPPAKAKALNLNIKIANTRIGYVMGAGDEIPQALREMGYQVTDLDENSIKGNLLKYDAIVIGVRAYNTKDWLANSQKLILNYVKNGGNLLVQYQTQAFYGKIKTDELGPYPLTIGRGRVTDETAKVHFIRPDDPLLNYPNKISESDFEGWVQERGLYFAEKWSDKYKSVIEMADPEETAQQGALLYTKYGKGNFIFTGLALFRQLPAGVPGAYKLMANMLSMKK